MYSLYKKIVVVPRGCGATLLSASPILSRLEQLVNTHRYFLNTSRTGFKCISFLLLILFLTHIESKEVAPPFNRLVTINFNDIIFF